MNRNFQAFIILLLLTGIAAAQPILRVVPNPLKYGYISVGGSQQRDIILYNVGDQDLSITSCDYIAPFYVEPVAGLTIAPGDSVVVSTGFNPESEDTYDGYHVFNYNNLDDPEYVLFIHANSIQPFERGEIIWSYQHIDNVVCVTAADDYNADGLPDVVAEGYDTGASGDQLVCLSGSGFDQPDQIWSTRPEGGYNSGGFGDDCLAYVDDLNNDGYEDIVRGSAWFGRTVFAINGKTGEEIWSYDTYQHPYSGWIYSVDQMGDINGDGVPEILAGAGSDANRCYCLDGATGELIWRYRGDDAISSVVSPGDVNNDGLNDAVCASTDDGVNIYCISAEPDDSGLAVIIWSQNIGENTYSLSAIADINDDGYNDIIAGTWGGGVKAISGRGIAGHSTVLWDFPMNVYVMRVVNCPDLDDDGIEDVLVASWSDYALALSGADGTEIWHSNCGNNVWAIDYIEDVNDDGIVEVAAGSFARNVYLIDGATGQNLWQTDVGSRLLTVRGIDDINGDGFNDVIAGTEYFDDEGGEVFVISGWGEEHVGIAAGSETLPDDIMIASNYPNPFNSSTVIKFSLAKTEDYSLSIYDIAGRLVKHIDGSGQAGINRVTWDLADNEAISTGIYFYRISTDTQAAAGKMTYLK